MTDTATMGTLDTLDMIRKGIAALYSPGDVVEARVPKARNGKGTISGYFNDFDLLAQAIAELSGKHDGIYLLLNSCNTDLIARAENKIKTRVQITTSDADIPKRKKLLIDIDPVRPAGISSTNEEKKHAKDLTTKVYKYLKSLGWTDPLIADSGNGFHLIYNIDLPNTKEVTETIKAFLKSLADRFDNDHAKVDRSVHNAARIVKAYGSLAAKGDSTEDRPHRIAQVLKTGSVDGIVTLQQIQEQIQTVPSVAPSSNSGYNLGSSILKTPGTITAEQIEEQLERCGIGHHGIADGTIKGQSKWVLDECPFNPDHAGKDAAVFLTDGIPGFRCLHNSCVDNHWKEFRAKVEELSGTTMAFGGTVTVGGTPLQNPAPLAGSHKQIKKITVTRFAEAKEKPMQFWWNPYFPLGELIMLSGDPGDGKSWFALLIASMLTNGKTFSDFGTEIIPCDPGNVLLIAAEDSFTKTLKKRARELGANQNRLMRLTGLLEEPDGAKDEVTLTAEDIPLLEAAVIEHKARMLIIDPLACFGGDLNLNQSSQMRQVTTPLKQLAEKHNILIIVIRHNRKTDDGQQAIYKGSGSIDGTGAARSELAFIRLPVDPELDHDGILVQSPIQKFAAIHIKHNLTPKGRAIAYAIQDGHLQITGLSDKTDKDVLGQHKKEDTMLIDNWLKNLLKDGAVSAVEAEKQAIAFEWGRTKRSNARERLGVITKPIGFGKGWYWGYPEQLEALKAQAKAEAEGEVQVSQVSQVPKYIAKFGPTDLPPLSKGSIRRLYPTKADLLKQFTGEGGKELDALMDTHSLVTRQSSAGGYAIDLVPLIQQEGQL